MQRKSKLHRVKRKFRSDIPYQAGLHLIKKLLLTEDYHDQGGKTHSHLRGIAGNIRVETTRSQLTPKRISKSFSMIILTHLTQIFSTMNFCGARPEYSGNRWAHITYRTSKHHSYLEGLHVA